MVFFEETFEANKVVETLHLECLSLKHRIALHQDDLRIANDIVGELNTALDESKAIMEAKEKELEDQKVQYDKLYEESMGMVSKAMLKVRVDLFYEFQEGTSGSWNVAKAIKDY